MHRERIVDFITRTSLTLVHSHPNNFDTVDGNGDPIVIELTFSNNPVAISNATPVVPHRADAPNDPLAPDIVLKFKN